MPNAEADRNAYICLALPPLRVVKPARRSPSGAAFLILCAVSLAFVEDCIRNAPWPVLYFFHALLM
jgi:hypothetical protein